MVLITGHTHESLDRFFAFLLLADWPEMWRTMLAALRTWLAVG